MTEQSPSQTNSANPEQQRAVPSFLRIEALEDLRFKQDLAHNNYLMEMNDDDFAVYSDEDGEDRHRIYMEVIDQYLADSGVSRDDERYDEVKAFLESASPDAIHDYQWVNTKDERDNRIESGREAVAKAVRRNFSWEVTESDGSPQSEGSDTESPTSQQDDAERDARDAEFAELETAVEEARELWATESAKRQDRLFSWSRPSKKQQSLREDYFAKVQALGHRHLQEHADYSEESKNIIATTILFDEQEKLRELTTSKLEDKKISKIIHWMNKGNVATRIGKGVAIGAGAGLAGSFLAGAIGAGIIAGGAVAVTRFARGFALKDHDKRGMQTYEDVLETDVNNLNVQTQDDTLRMKLMDASMGSSNEFEKDTRREQSKRRKAAAYGIGSMAVGSVMGYGIHEITERLSDANLTVTHWLHNKWDDFWSGPEEPAPSVPEHSPSPQDVHPGGPGVEHNPGGGHHHSVIDLADVPHDARWVEPGEGWYQTFQELGIPQDHWTEVLQDAGPKLHEQGWAYRMDNGQWGISQPGRLPNESLRVIAAAAKQDGFDLAV